MRVGVDPNGYFYDLETGYYLSLEYDEYGNAYVAGTDEPVEYVDLGEVGGPAGYTVWAGGAVDWNNLINIAGQTAVGIAGGAGQTGRYIPIQGQAPPTGQAPIPSSPRPSLPTMPGGGISGGLNISTTTLMLLGGAVLIFMLGSQRGGRR